MSHQVVRVKREAVAPSMTCPLCHKLLREATTIIECLHTFCRKCIYEKLSDEEMESCPICNIDLGCVPLKKLRLDHNLQDVRAKIFPYKRIKVRAPDVVSPVTLPAKRKERSLSSLVVSTPRVSPQSAMTGRRSKSTARKASRGPSFTIGRPARRDDSSEDQSESSSSLETLKKFTQNVRQNSGAGEPSNRHRADKRREDRSEAGEGKVDPWKPLNCLVEAANRSKSSKFSAQGSGGESEPLHSRDDEGLVLDKPKNREHRQKSKVQEDKNCSDRDHTPEPERPKKLRRVRQKKGEDSGEFRVPPQVVLDADPPSAKSERRNYPIWFSLVSDEQDGVARHLPQIAASYLRIKDGSIPVSSIQKYLKMKLGLTSEDEVEIKCMGQPVGPTLTLNYLIDLWLQTTTAERVSATVWVIGKRFRDGIGLCS